MRSGNPAAGGHSRAGVANSQINLLLRRCALLWRRRSERAATRGLDPQYVSGPHFSLRLRGQAPTVEQVSTDGSVASAFATGWRPSAPLADQTEAGRPERLYLPDQPLAAMAQPA